MNNLIVTLSGPSAVGKTEVLKSLLQSNELPFKRVISSTTRPIRDKEVDGEDYYFTDRKSFMEKVDAGQVLQFDTINGNLYGTYSEEMDRVLNSGGLS